MITQWSPLWSAVTTRSKRTPVRSYFGFVPISAPHVPVTDNDVLRSRSRKHAPPSSVRVVLASTVDRESVKEAIDSFFFQLDQQKEIMDRYEDMKTAIARQIVKTALWKKTFGRSASPHLRTFSFPKASLITCAREYKMISSTDSVTRRSEKP